MDSEFTPRDYEELHTLTTTPGYKVLKRLIESRVVGIADIRSIQDGETLKFRQGQLDVCDLVVHLRDVAQALMEQQEADNESP